MFYIMLLSTQIPNFIKIGVFLIFLRSIFGGVVPPPGGADAEILKHVSIKMLISTQIPNFIEIGAFLIFFSYKLQRGGGGEGGGFFWAPDLKVLRKQDFIDGVKFMFLSLNAI